MIEEKKKPKGDPIKQIGLDIPPLASSIVIQIANALGMRVRYDKDEEGNFIGVSAYIGNCLRLADHRTYLQTWVDAGTWNAPYRYDIVIEDEPTIAKTQVQAGYDFTVLEYVVNSQEMDVEKAKMIAYDIRNAINTGAYANNIGAERIRLESNHESDTQQQAIAVNTNKKGSNGGRGTPSAPVQPSIKESKTNKNMKNTIKLNESQLRQIVAESVKKVLKEGIRDIEGLGEEIKDAEGIAYELREKIGALQSKVNTIYGYMPTNTDEYDDGVKKYLENAYSAIKQCVFALDDAFQFYDGGA